METPSPLDAYRLLACSVAGWKLALVPAADPHPYTDGQAIFMPEAVGEDPRAALVVQAALLAAGSLEPRVVAQLRGRPRSLRRYLTLEAARAMREVDHAVPRRIARLVAAHWDGDPPGSPQESLKRAFRGGKVPEAPEWFGTIRPSKLIRAGAGGGAAPTEADERGKSKWMPTRELEDEDDSEQIKILKLLHSPLANRMPRWVQDILGMGTAPSPDGEGAAELPVGGMTLAEAVGANARPLAPPEGLEGEPPGRSAHGRRYPEWDYRKRSYRRGWCAVREYDPAPGELDPSLVPGADLRLRRELARFGLAFERHRRQREGEDIDPTALVEYVIDTAAGQSGDDRVYEARLRTAHDLGVLILLDATGSTGEASEGEEIFEAQRRVVAHLTAVLDELGDRVAAYGFRSHGREDVHFLRVKDFDDRFDHAAHRRLAGLEPGGFTRLGAAIRHGSHLVETKAGTSNLLLVLVADGLPYDNDGYEEVYAERDARRALSEAVARGVGCACVSVRSGVEEERIERVWGNVPYRRLSEDGQLARHVRPLFGGALKLAASSPRRSGTRRRSSGQLAELARAA